MNHAATLTHLCDALWNCCRPHCHPKRSSDAWPHCRHCSWVSFYWSCCCCCRQVTRKRHWTYLSHCYHHLHRHHHHCCCCCCSGATVYDDVMRISSTMRNWKSHQTRLPLALPIILYVAVLDRTPNRVVVVKPDSQMVYYSWLNSTKMFLIRKKFQY